MHRKISDLRHLLALEAPVDTQDDAGGFARSWQLVDHIHAAIEPSGAGGSLTAEKLESSMRLRIVIRWRPDVAAHMRLREGSRIYRIHSVFDADDRRRFMTCQCEEISP